MKNTIKVGVLFLILVSFKANAQRDTVVHTHLVGFDANSMISQFVPFNTITPSVGFPAIITRRMWNNKGFRSTAGFHLDPNSFNIDNFYFSFGYTAKKDLGKRISWIKGIDIKAYSEGNDFGFFGIAPYWGVEYNFNEIISVSTETAIQLGLIDGPVLDIKPPIHIQCHFKLK
ncbi:MAG: hypothetical protein COA58_01020 [Bacteroidetes bacterium]|nr:MAG: hypothetical protein COA58_01020 [Bacteroidota bacterium]